MTLGKGMSTIRVALGTGLVMLALAGTDALAARNCVSNTGNGKSPRLRNLKAVGLTADQRLLP